MTEGAAALSRVWWHGFRQLRSPHRHHDPAIAQRLLDAAAAEPDELLKQLGTTHEGLDTQTAAQRLSTFGPNLVARERQQNVVRELIGRAKNPLNFLLLSLASVSYFFGDTRAAMVIAVMVVLSVSLAFLQEHRSNNAAAQLRAMVRTTATVLRRHAGGAAGELALEIPIEELVPGDVVSLSAGDMIPADLRVLAAKDLFPERGVADRRGDAGREGGGSESRPEGCANGPAQYLLHGQQRTERRRHCRRRSIRRRDLFRRARRNADKAARADQLRQRGHPLYLADDK
jgi:hypothetical protein